MNTLFLHLSAAGSSQAWLASAAGIVALGETDIGSLAQQHPAHATVLFLPSSSCLFTTVTASNRQLRQAGQSLAWLIEDQCGEDAENLQVIAAPVGAEDQAPLLGISRAQLQEQLTHLRMTGLRVVAALPDLFLLPRPDTVAAACWQLAEGHDGGLILRTGSYSGAVLESSLLETMLNAALQETPPAGINAHVQNDALRARLQHWLETNSLDADISAELLDPAAALSTVVDWTKHAGNFMHGSFAVSQRFALPQSLRIAAVFMAAAFSLQLLSEWAHYAYYHYQAGKVGNEIVVLYKQANPDARLRSARPVDEVRKRFKSEQNQGGNDGVSTLPKLTRIAESLQGSGLNTQRVDFSNGVFTLDVDARALGEIDSLRQRLDAQGFSTEIVSANAQGGLVRGRLRVEGGA
ncbi:MAG: type II secretion system protein GspL [Moraxellaceae bacterium]